METLELTQTDLDLAQMSDTEIHAFAALMAAYDAKDNE